MFDLDALCERNVDDRWSKTLFLGVRRSKTDAVDRFASSRASNPLFPRQKRLRFAKVTATFCQNVFRAWYFSVVIKIFLFGFLQPRFETAVTFAFRGVRRRDWCRSKAENVSFPTTPLSFFNSSISGSYGAFYGAFKIGSFPDPSINRLIDSISVD